MPRPPNLIGKASIATQSHWEDGGRAWVTKTIIWPPQLEPKKWTGHVLLWLKMSTKMISHESRQSKQHGAD